MSKEGHPQAKVVDLRRWREEKERRQRAALPEPPPQPEPPRFSGRLRATRLISWLGQWIRPVPSFLVVSVLLVALGSWRQDADPFAWEPALYWGVAFLHILFHEVGHLLAVYRVGYSPRVLRAGPVLVEWKGRRASVRANRDWRFVLGGHVWFTPVRPSRGRDLAVLLAGPLANLLVLGAVLALSRWLAGTHLFAQYVRANIACAILVLLVNLLPLPRTRGYATDGRQILDLLRGRRIA